MILGSIQTYVRKIISLESDIRYLGGKTRENHETYMKTMFAV